ncbi:Glutathione S-transferase T3 [Bienertia sinuspersici]
MTGILLSEAVTTLLAVCNDQMGSNSQHDEYRSEEENVPETQEEPIMTPPVASIQRRAVSSTARSWSVKEDEALIACYMQHCTDAIIGTNQKASTLWRKVAESWEAAQKNRPFELPVRGPKMLENRWRRMASDINLWVGCYEEAKKATGSGYNEDDTVQTAHTLFQNSTTPPRNFLCEHGWRMLCAYPKWRVKMRWAMSKKEREIANSEGNAEESSGSGKKS